MHKIKIINTVGTIRWLTWLTLFVAQTCSIVELVDAAVPQQQLDPHRETILQVEGVKVLTAFALITLKNCKCMWLCSSFIILKEWTISGLVVI